MSRLRLRLQSHIAWLCSSWAGPAIERYKAWLVGRQSSPQTIQANVGRARTFCQFAMRRGAKRCEDLPSHLEAFLSCWVRRREPRRRPGAVRTELILDSRWLVGQFLRVAVPGTRPATRPQPLPFLRTAPGFWDHLTSERGLQPATIQNYVWSLSNFETYLRKRGRLSLARLTPRLVGSFIVGISERMGTLAVRTNVAVLRVLVRYLHRERILRRDFSPAIEGPIFYRLSSIPRSITWDEVGRLLRAVDPDFPGGIRNRTILLLLVCYGLRAADVSRLLLEDIDWRKNRLFIRGRKSGNSTVYPLSQVVGEAILDYLKRSRPKTADRHVFVTAIAPRQALRPNAVGSVVRYQLKRAGIAVPRYGAHVLRYTCVQRLVDSGFPLKTIGDYVGHHSVASTEVYSKINVEALRELANGEGEAAL